MTEQESKAPSACKQRDQLDVAVCDGRLPSVMEQMQDHDQQTCLLTGQMFAVVRLIATLALEPATLTFTGQRSVIMKNMRVPPVRLTTGFSLSALTETSLENRLRFSR